MCSDSHLGTVQSSESPPSSSIATPSSELSYLLPHIRNSQPSSFSDPCLSSIVSLRFVITGPTNSSTLSFSMPGSKSTFTEPVVTAAKF
ncbi:hypothetical protein Nepgr_005108 [Nepenthes gracilis]|uniref:Uncharacterized protein n=1 Tax=Nepenthes gracilis TaxID=150966 RepID=A0AAD3XFX7_NEPGR|nr:hypothetical protein Nepgr_005108 [Nepenthes gracilis]